MNIIRKRVAGGSGFFLIVWIFTAATAAVAGSIGQNGQGGQHVQQQLNPNPKDHKYDPFFGLIHKLDMSKAQKAEVAEVLKENEDQAKKIAQEMAGALVQVRRDFVQGKFSDAHFDNLVKFERQAAQLRARVMSSILPELTMDQRTKLAKLQDKVSAKISSKIDARFSRLNNWISKNSKGP